MKSLKKAKIICIRVLELKAKAITCLKICLSKKDPNNQVYKLAVWCLCDSYSLSFKKLLNALSQ